MCGIVGYVGKNNKSLDVVLNGLKVLEYRGYDSAGIAYTKDNGLIITKTKGKVKELEDILQSCDSNLAIGHTRWATHGEPSDTNSHPHKIGKITIVHNGIIENYAEIKTNLLREGYSFKSETDTEVAVALLDKLYNETNDIKETIMKFQNQVTGSYALGIIVDDDYDNLYAVKKGSPLIIGLNDNENYIASDVPAIIKYTNKYTILNDGDFAILNSNNIKYFNKEGIEINKDIKTFDKELGDNSKGIYEHFMLKEIYEQPDVFIKTVNPYMENGFDSLVEKMHDFSTYNKIVIVACGSAMHAGLIGKNLIEKYADTPVSVEIASEFRYKEKLFIDDKSLVIAISQSGETADTLEAIKIAKKHSSETIGIINRVDSSIAREVDEVLYTKAGIEHAVATTKAYSAQIALLSLIAMNIANYKNNISNEEKLEILSAIRELPNQITKLLSDSYREQYHDIASKIYDKNDIFFIGRGVDHALCMEGSLKLKEISYIHSEAYAAGELKHGTISLIENGTPVVGIITNSKIADKTLSNLKETSSRGSKNYLIITDDLAKQYQDSNVDYNSYDKVIIPKTNDLLQPLLAVIPLQLIAYETAYLNNCDIDKPKNLAKSVTVE